MRSIIIMSGHALLYFKGRWIKISQLLLANRSHCIQRLSHFFCSLEPRIALIFLSEHIRCLDIQQFFYHILHIFIALYSNWNLILIKFNRIALLNMRKLLHGLPIHLLLELDRCN
jgi:hypothetical protein